MLFPKHILMMILGHLASTSDAQEATCSALKSLYQETRGDGKSCCSGTLATQELRCEAPAVSSLKGAMQAVDETFATPFKLWKAMKAAHLAGGSTASLSFPAGDLNSHPNTDYNNAGLMYTWNGYVDNSQPALAPMSTVSVASMTNETLAKSLVGLGINMYYVVSPVNNNMWANRPFRIDDVDVSKGIAVKHAREYMEEAMATASMQGVDAKTKQSLLFARGQIKRQVRYITEVDYPDGLDVLRGSKYSGLAPYQLDAYNGMLSQGLPNLPRWDFENSTSWTAADLDKVLDDVEVYVPEYINRVTDWVMMQSLSSHGFQRDDPRYLFGYDQTGPNMTEVETGLTRWHWFGKPILNAQLRLSQVGYSGTKGWNDYVDYTTGSYKLQNRNTPFDNTDSLWTSAETPFWYDMANNMLFTFRNQFTEAQKVRAQAIVDGPIATAHQKHMHALEQSFAKMATDDFPFAARNTLQGNIHHVDAAKKVVVMEDGTEHPFHSPYLFDMAVAVDAHAQEYFSAFETYSLPKKLDTTKGYDTGKTAYTGLLAISENYAGEDVDLVPVTRDNIGSNDVTTVIDAHYESGKRLVDLFDEFKAYAVTLSQADGLLDGWSSPTAAPEGSKQWYREAAVHVDESALSKSDWDTCGYHYGLPADASGVVLNAYNPAIRSGPPTAAERLEELDMFGKPKVDGTLNSRCGYFDYAVREHYVIQTDGTPEVNPLDGLYVSVPDRTELDVKRDDLDDYLIDETTKSIWKVPRESSVCMKMHQWTAQSMVNTLFYEPYDDNGVTKYGVLTKIGLFDESVLETYRTNGVSAFVIGSGYAVFHNVFDAEKTPLYPHLTWEDYAGPDGAPDVTLEQFRSHPLYTPALEPDSPSAGKVKAWIGMVWQFNDIQRQPMAKHSAQVLMHEMLGHGVEFSYAEMLKRGLVAGKVATDTVAPWPMTKTAPESSVQGWLRPLDVVRSKYQYGRWSWSDYNSGDNFYTRTSGNDGEGFATWFELCGPPSGILGPVVWGEKRIQYADANGTPLIDPVNLVTGMVLFSRLAARQVMAARASYIKYTTSASYMFREFSENMGRTDTQFWKRFAGVQGVLQQGTYALALTQVMASANAAKQVCASKGTTFSQPKFNTWRMYNGRGLWGNTLLSVVRQLATDGDFDA